MVSSRSEEHTSELQSPVPISYAVFCLKKKKNRENTTDRKSVGRERKEPKNTRTKQKTKDTCSKTYNIQTVDG